MEPKRVLPGYKNDSPKGYLMGTARRTILGSRVHLFFLRVYPSIPLPLSQAPRIALLTVDILSPPPHNPLFSPMNRRNDAIHSKQIRGNSHHHLTIAYISSLLLPKVTTSPISQTRGDDETSWLVRWKAGTGTFPTQQRSHAELLITDSERDRRTNRRLVEHGAGLSDWGSCTFR